MWATDAASYGVNATVRRNCNTSRHSRLTWTGAGGPLPRMRRLLFAICAVLCPLAASAAGQDRFFTTGDGVRLHVIDAGPANAPVLLMVPGWSMPAWIFKAQIDALSTTWRVVAMDPRGQGDSEVPATGYDSTRRGQDIADLIAALGNRPVVLLGWSLGVLDSLAYVHTHGDGLLLGLVLVDNSVGEDPAPPPPRPRRPGPRVERDVYMRSFVRSMFRQPPPEAYLERLTAAALRTPPGPAAQLLDYRMPRTYWKEAVLSMRRPVLYAITPRWQDQADNLQLHQPLARVAVFPGAGHALFVDQAATFNAVLQDFLRRVGT